MGPSWDDLYTRPDTVVQPLVEQVPLDRPAWEKWRARREIAWLLLAVELMALVAAYGGWALMRAGATGGLG